MFAVLDRLPMAEIIAMRRSSLWLLRSCSPRVAQSLNGKIFFDCATRR